MASMKKRAQSAKREDVQEAYSCTNQEVLDALFIGVGSGTSTSMGAAAQNEESQDVRELEEDSSAEEEEDLLR